VTQEQEGQPGTFPSSHTCSFSQQSKNIPLKGIKVDLGTQSLSPASVLDLGKLSLPLKATPFALF
jgi:hypothetical protein